MTGGYSLERHVLRVKTLAGALTVLLAHVASDGGGGDTSGTTTSARTRRLVQLQEQNFSGESGTVTLTPEGDKTRVDIEWPATRRTRSRRTSTRGRARSSTPTPRTRCRTSWRGQVDRRWCNVPLKALLNGKYAINVHRSAKKLKVYVACGDITRHSAPAETITASEDDD